MVKYSILLINILALFAYKVFVGDNVTITPTFPANVKAGSEFVVEITINRTDVEGFAILQQELPKGFTAKEAESHEASFTFTKQTVKFIWTSLPPEQEFKISYKIMVDKKVEGETTIGGKFSYVSDNVKKNVELPASIVNVESAESKASAEAQTPDNKNAEAAADTAAQSVKKDTLVAEQSSQASCKRIISPEVNGEFMVEIMISKGNLSGFAKLQENIPQGYTATPVKTNNASFTFTEQKVKFVWPTLPPETEYTVSYKVKSDNNLKDSASIDGVFSFLENDEPKKFILPPMSLSIKAGDTMANNLVNSLEENKKVEEAVKKEEPAVDSSQKTNPVVANIPAPQTDVVYKVQIAALHNPVDVSYFKTKHSIGETVGTEMHEGWTKYTIGAFPEYKKARDHRENVKTKNIQGPFVTAYNSGKRITVQEALMITSQKWYK
jgi:hypothetical protein